MKSNKQIALEMLDVIINARQFERDMEFYFPESIYHGPTYVGIGYLPDDTSGVIKIKLITPGAPADGHLQVGDQIVAVSDEHVSLESYEMMKNYNIGHGVPGTNVTMRVLRDGKEMQFTLTRAQIQGNNLVYKDVRDLALIEYMKLWPDLKVKVHMAVEEGDLVVVYCVYSGTNVEYHRFAIWPVMEIYKFKDGRIMESWGIEDQAIQWPQLGYTIHPPGR